jgi:hypothetical protein
MQTLKYGFTAYTHVAVDHGQDPAAKGLDFPGAMDPPCTEIQTSTGTGLRAFESLQIPA